MQQVQQQRRETAYKVCAADIIGGNFVKRGGWSPNYVEISGGIKASRVNIIGAIVSKENSGQGFSFILDDSTAKLPVRAFEQVPFANTIMVGDAAMIIGRIREFNNEKYVVPEVIRKVESAKWVEVRKLELGGRKEAYATVPETGNKAISIEDIEEIKDRKEAEASREALPSGKTDSEKAYEFVKANDKGSGVSVDFIVENSGIKFSEKAIRALLENGDVFEIRPGVIKALE